MSNKDFAVGISAAPLVTGAITKKPAHLVILTDPTGKKFYKFIAFEKPDILNGFIQVKGIYSEELEDDIIKNYSDIVLNCQNSRKDSILELMLPWHLVCSIRNLVFKAK